jgi:hypothetical protein
LCDLAIWLMRLGFLRLGRLGAPRPIQAYVRLHACVVLSRAVEWGLADKRSDVYIGLEGPEVVREVSGLSR